MAAKKWPRPGSELYADKLILAPMVRAGRTPLRLLTLEYGAQLVYTEELIDQKLLSTERVENSRLGTIDYVLGEEIVLRIHPQERERLVLQIGTAGPELAAKVARKIGKDVAAIDVNMGCPKSFSISGGMGAALITDEPRAVAILEALVREAHVPVSCKIRVRDEPEDTVLLAKKLVQTGIVALGVHGRRRDERQQHANRIAEIKRVVQELQHEVPIIANGGSGEIECLQDLLDFRSATGASSVMIARAALSKPSVFRPEGPLSFEVDVANFLRKSVDVEDGQTTVKYVIQRILGGLMELDPRGKATIASGTVKELCAAWSCEDHYREVQERRKSTTRKRKYDEIDENGCRMFDVTFPQRRLRDLSGAGSPKCHLLEYCRRNNLEKPVFETTIRADHKFEGTCRVADRGAFRSSVRQPNRKMAEQVSALAALIGLGEIGSLPENWRRHAEESLAG